MNIIIFTIFIIILNLSDLSSYNIYYTNNTIFHINTLNYNKNNIIYNTNNNIFYINIIIIKIIIFITQINLFLILILLIIIKIIIFITQIILFFILILLIIIIINNIYNTNNNILGYGYTARPKDIVSSCLARPKIDRSCWAARPILFLKCFGCGSATNTIGSTLLAPFGKSFGLDLAVRPNNVGSNYQAKSNSFWQRRKCPQL